MTNKRTPMVMAELRELRRQLPHGSYGIIADKTGYSYAQVRAVLTGARNINANNVCIVKAAKKIVDEISEVTNIKKTQEGGTL